MGPHVRCRAPLAGVAIALLVATGAARAQSEQREAHEVTKLTINGIHHVDRTELEKSIATQASSCKGILLKPFCLISHSHLWYDKHYLDQTELKRDVLRIKVFYWKRGYRETKVDTSVARVPGHQDDVHVTFSITEGPPTLVRTIAVLRPDSLIDDKTIAKTMRVRAGEPLNLLDLDSSRVLLRDQMWDAGYADAVLTDTTIVHDSLRIADVSITIDPRWRTTIGSVTITGNEKISRSTIDNMLRLRPGDLYKRSDVIESQRNLYASNLFRHAVIIVPPKGDSVKQMEVTVQEAPMHEARVSAGFNTVDFLQTEGRFTNYNWFGGARQLDLRIILSNLLAPTLNGNGIFQDVTGYTGISLDSANVFLQPNYQASADITQPYFRDSRNTLGLGIFAHRRTSPGIFVDKGYGASASFTREVAIQSPLSLVYRYEITEVLAGDVYFCVNYGVCERPTISTLRGRSALSPVSFDLFTTRTDDPFSPTHGYTARLDLEHASKYTLSDFRYNRISGDATRYQPLGHAVLAGHIRFGWVKPIGGGNGLDSLGQVLHPRKRFYAGGANSVRGYGENQLGPRVLTIDPKRLVDAGCSQAEIAAGNCSAASLDSIASSDFSPVPTGGTSLIEASLEYRFPTAMKHLWGAVFVDGAYVGEGNLTDVTHGNGAITPGFGVRYESPVGPIRVDIGIRPTLKEDLSVITEATNPDGSHRIVRLTQRKTYNPVEGSSGFKKIINRLALHLQIGQAF